MSDANETLLREWETFKKSNDERLAQIEKKGHADPLLSEKVDRNNAEITRLENERKALETRLAELETRAGRLGSQVENENPASKVRAAFEQFIRNGVESDLLKRAASVGTAGSGGYMVPEDFDRSIGEVLRNGTPMRQVCNVIRTATENYVKVYNLGGAASGWVGETDARTETTSPTLAKLTPVYGEVYANVYSTRKLMDDSAFDVSSWLTSEVAKEFAKQENNKFTATDATGTNSPKGLLAYTMAATADASRTFGQIEKVTSATQGTIIADELITLEHKLKPGYRANAVWMMPTATVAVIRKFKDATTGQYLWQPGLGGGQPANLLGYRIVENEDFPAIGNNVPVLALGDFKAAYTIADVGTQVALPDPYSAKPYIAFYFTRRVGGFLSDSNAVKVLVTHA